MTKQWKLAFGKCYCNGDLSTGIGAILYHKKFATPSCQFGKFFMIWICNHVWLQIFYDVKLPMGDQHFFSLNCINFTIFSWNQYNVFAKCTISTLYIRFHKKKSKFFAGKYKQFATTRGNNFFMIWNYQCIVAIAMLYFHCFFVKGIYLPWIATTSAR